MYLNEKCPGCKENTKASWCKVRTCCLENKYQTCADCQKIAEIKDCKKHNNFISKIFSFIFKSDRRAGIQMIKSKGCHEFAKHMAEHGLQSIKKK